MKKSFIIASIILLLIIIGAGGAWMLSQKSEPKADDQGIGHWFKSQPPRASFIEIKDLVITLQADDNRPRYLLLDVVLVVRGEEQSAQAQAFEPAVRSATVGLLNNQPFSDVRARTIPELHDQLLKRYQEEANQLGLKTLPFDDIMISKMVFQ
ncbi:flagellar basal body-associated FliL family protein [Rosenbergiella australiborealis]|uniref:Flagellar protein FliL n=1 Tax=Rosenbergiella australiborealis TaxID=1544696 RepID=A0ABS5T5G2_9GAMM|nr:flagellar basal body-associated FliL family protein [Rosenbergiella australiborealis]MBT0727582.1 flagellar basal body-associated FliL family protein [Rosenbergiella australiborealis]